MRRLVNALIYGDQSARLQTPLGRAPVRSNRWLGPPRTYSQPQLIDVPDVATMWVL
jgi:hypothetical protein